MKRPLRVSSSTVTAGEFLALQAKWDAKLARSGFVDIEAGMDTNLICGSTFRRASDTDHGVAVILGLGHEEDMTASEDVAGGRRSVFDSPRARAWALFSQAAHELPDDSRTRRILITVAETGNQREAVRRLSRRTSGRLFWAYEKRVDKAVRGLCAAIGIDRRWLFGSLFEDAREEEMTPISARELTKTELRKLKYDAPTGRSERIIKPIRVHRSGRSESRNAGRVESAWTPRFFAETEGLRATVIARSMKTKRRSA